MFEKLRNKLLLLNISIILVLMLSAFTTIFLITYNTANIEIDKELNRISTLNGKTKSENKPVDLFEKPNFPMPSEEKNEFPDFNPLPERTVSFAIITNSSWNILNKMSFFTLEDSLYTAAAEAAKISESRTGYFVFDSIYWNYLINSHESGYRIVYLDTSAHHIMLNNMLFAFFVVATLTIIIIFIISLYLTNKSIQPIKNAFERQKQFVSDASHELKTPLAVISTNLDLVLNNDSETIKSQEKWLLYIKTEILRMSKLTNDLLYLAQADNIKKSVSSTKFNLSNQLESIVLSMEALAFEKSIRIDYYINPGIEFFGNQEQISQVILILIDNAIKYTPENGVINISLSKDTHFIIFKTTNSGLGIPSNELDKIFDRFYRFDSSRNKDCEGFGLGLPIAQSIIKNHNGKISAESVKDSTTSFIVKLPLTHK